MIDPCADILPDRKLTKKFLITNKKTNQTFESSDSYELAIWLWGKDANDYVIIKHYVTIITLTNSEVTNMKNTLDAA